MENFKVFEYQGMYYMIIPSRVEEDTFGIIGKVETKEKALMMALNLYVSKFNEFRNRFEGALEYLAENLMDDGAFLKDELSPYYAQTACVEGTLRDKSSFSTREFGLCEGELLPLLR